MQTTPLVQIVFKISGFESGTIISPSTNITSFFVATILFTHIFSFIVSKTITLTSFIILYIFI